MVDGLAITEDDLSNIKRCLDFLRLYASEEKAVVLMGSAVSPDLWKRGTSDIDLNIFVGEGSVSALEKIAVNLNRISSSEYRWCVRPHIIQDIQQPRIEGILCNASGQRYDLTWGGNELMIGDDIDSVPKDNLELYIGNMYVHAFKILGDVPECHPLIEVLPYYNEDLRVNRLQILEESLHGYFDQLSYFLRACDLASALRCSAALQGVFLQALFVAKKKYPLSYEKHIGFQLRNYLTLSNEDLGSIWGEKDIGPSFVASRKEAWFNALSCAREG